MTQCGAQTRAGTPCKQPAGWGTDHVGEGRCKLHGGNAGRKPKHGRYSVKHRQELADKLGDYLQDSRPADLADELAMMRTLFQNFLDTTPDPETDEYYLMFNMLEAIGRLVERISRIYNETALTAAEIAFFQSRIADILVKYIDESERRHQALAELRESFQPPRLNSPASR